MPHDIALKSRFTRIEMIIEPLEIRNRFTKIWRGQTILVVDDIGAAINLYRY